MPKMIKKYKVKVICNSKVYVKKVMRPLLRLYNLIFWKRYIKEKRIWELVLAVIHLRNMISTFHQNYFMKSIIILIKVKSILTRAKPITKLTMQILNIAKKKYGQLAKTFTKLTKKVYIFRFLKKRY